MAAGSIHQVPRETSSFRAGRMSSRWSPFWALPGPLGTGHLDEKNQKPGTTSGLLVRFGGLFFLARGDACALRLRELARAVERSPVASLQQKGSSEPF